MPLNTHRPQPFIGPNYGRDPDALRIMVVGESHYHRQDEAPPIGIDFTQATISVAEDRIDSGFHGSFLVPRSDCWWRQVR